MNTIVQLIKNFFRRKQRNGTVRYMFPALVSFVALLSASVITTNEASYIKLEASKTTIEAGKQFSIDVLAYAHVPVNAVDITLQFDEEVFSVTGVDKGQSVLTIWTEEPIIEDGKVILRGGTFRKGFLKEHLIATVNLQAKETGQSVFEATDVVLLAGDGQGTQVTVAGVTDSTASLYVYDEGTDSDSISVDISVDLITDIDGDGEVSLKDISAFMGAWRNKETLYDFNGDGKMSFKDFSIILANFFF